MLAGSWKQLLKVLRVLWRALLEDLEGFLKVALVVLLTLQVSNKI